MSTNEILKKGIDKKVVVYNSSFGFGDPKVGHTFDINYCTHYLVKPNKHRALAIGIGWPDPPEYFSEIDMRWFRIGKGFLDFQEYKEARDKRLPEPENFVTYFERLYILEMLLRDEIPTSEGRKDLLKELDIHHLSEGSYLIYPKHTHILYPYLYDIRRDSQGFLEPNKNEIACEYMFSDTVTAKQRIRAKETERRNINIVTLDNDVIPEKVREKRLVSILKSEEREDILNSLKEKEFELYVLSDTPLDETQIRYIDQTIEAAYKNNREAVFAVPYARIPETISENKKFWLTQRIRMARGEFLPFERYEITKNYLEKILDKKHEGSLNEIHITFMEMKSDGSIPRPEMSFSYLPRKIALHGPKDVINKIKEAADTVSDSKYSPDILTHKKGFVSFFRGR
jgi:hypothetical protein